MLFVHLLSTGSVPAVHGLQHPQKIGVQEGDAMVALVASDDSASSADVRDDHCWLSYKGSKYLKLIGGVFEIGE